MYEIIAWLVLMVTSWIFVICILVYAIYDMFIRKQEKSPNEY